MKGTLIKKYILSGLIISGLLGLITNLAFAYVLDGQLEDWGITRSGDWISNWEPADPRIDRKVHNNIRETGGSVWGGEAYDIEAMYFDDDPSYIYFAMITSFPLIGWDTVLAGDLAIDFTGAPADDYRYGVRIEGIPSSEYGLSNRELRINPEWYFNGHNQGPIYMTDYGDFAGLADIYYWNAQAGGYLNEPSTDFETWILEGRINRLLFTPTPQAGDSIKLHWAMTCGNDYIDLNGDFDREVIPEPATLSLLGFGLLGILGFKIKGVSPKAVI